MNVKLLFVLAVVTSSSLATAEEPSSELITRCINAALDSGYINGQCADYFITTCIKTQSKAQMQGAIAMDKYNGEFPAAYCPNYSKKYEAEFNKLRAARDKF